MFIRSTFIWNGWEIVCVSIQDSKVNDNIYLVIYGKIFVICEYERGKRGIHESTANSFIYRFKTA
ncbi:hypothetical protein PspKH34_00240 [Parageobacillus sp. KH3-4]|nr:hypothetical protein PspKH34_00240 [Parageobacillus sp. KH3-4]